MVSHLIGKGPMNERLMELEEEGVEGVATWERDLIQCLPQRLTRTPNFSQIYESLTFFL